jgi:hypothetical protein
MKVLWKQLLPACARNTGKTAASRDIFASMDAEAASAESPRAFR